MSKLGSPAARSYRKPVCSEGHDPSRMRREKEDWCCLDCADFWVGEMFDPGKTAGGVILPAGSPNPDKPKFSTVMPNRRVRRLYK